jgi:glycosyltransferase involved in cell wall biosynthesis
VNMTVFSSVLRRFGLRLAKPLFAVKYAINHYGSAGYAIKKSLELYRKHGIGGLQTRARALLLRNGLGPEADVSYTNSGDLYSRGIGEESDYDPLVTVIVPNYNHAKYLKERLDSIYAQTYKNFEVLLLDDFSADDSRDILGEYAALYPSMTRCIFNDVNSGGVFKQWKKGLAEARGDLIWIAESDDLCTPNFLEENVRNFRNEGVMLSFARSVFATDVSSRLTWSTDEYLSFMGPTFWRTPFIRSAHWLVNNCWSLKNIVPNVSSAIFRKPNDMGLLEDPLWAGMKVCGDWVFYLHLVRGGLVSYTPLATNYYRQHDNNTSVTSQSGDRYYSEYEYVVGQMVAMYDLDRSMLVRLQQDLRRQWLLSRPNDPVDNLNQLFDIERIEQQSRHRSPNLLIFTYALAAGGGETFPLMLANLMKAHGYAVTVLNCHEQPTEPGVRTMLDRKIPLLQLKELEHIPWVIKELGIDVVHSHHAWVDITLASLFLGRTRPKHVISMHGMYEMMPEAQLKTLIPLMSRAVDRVVYTAEKNLLPFTEEFIVDKGFTRIDNALPITPVHPVDRSALGIGPDDFVLCLVSRAIEEKGWAEAVLAVRKAQERSSRPIHLLLIGEGPEYASLKAAGRGKGIHLLGFRKNIRDYFAMADVGMLPSRFKGESYPLVLIDCLHAGTPVLASDVGEIRSMLQTSEGMAGVLFQLTDWQIPVAQLTDLVLQLCDAQSGILSDVHSHVPAAARKFSPDKLFKSYDIIYREAAGLPRKMDVQEFSE